MKPEKETYTKDEVKELVSWLMNRCEYNQNRYIADERFIIEYLKYPFWKRWLFGRKILLDYMNTTMRTDCLESIFPPNFFKQENQK